MRGLQALGFLVMGYGLGLLQKGEAWGFLALAIGFVLVAHPLLDPPNYDLLPENKNEKSLKKEE